MSSFYGNHGNIGSGDGLPSVQPTDEGKALIVQNGEWVPGIVDANGLPEVTNNDNDKVLTVVDGNWVATYLNNTLFFEVPKDGTWFPTLSLTYPSERKYSDEEFNNILTPGDTYIVTLDGQKYELIAQQDENNPESYYLGEKDNNGDIIYNTYPFFVQNINNGPDEDNNIIITSITEDVPTEFKIIHSVDTTCNCLPIVTDADNGKILTVVNGNWVAADSSNNNNNNNNTELYWEADNNTVWNNDTTYTSTDNPINNSLVAGETYKVTYNGQEYILTAYKDLQGGCIVLGEFDYQNDEPNFEDYPFFIASYNNDDELGLYVAINDTTAPEDFKIEHIIKEATIFAPENDGDMLVGIDGEWMPVNIMDIQEGDTLLEYQNLTCTSWVDYENQSGVPYPDNTSTDAGYYFGQSEQDPSILADYVGETVIVSYDGIDYQCPVYLYNNYYYIGSNAENITNGTTLTTPGMFTEYPFLLMYGSYNGNWSDNIYTDSVGEHSIIVRANNSSTIIKSEYLPCQYIEDGTGDYAVIINGVDTLPSTGGYDPGTPKNIASGEWAIAEGKATEASGTSSHAEGERTVASGDASHAEGNYSIAQAHGSHAEGGSTKAYAGCSHAEGSGTEAGSATDTSTGYGAHAEGGSTKAIGDYSHSEGNTTVASGSSSHAEGYGTTANHRAQHVFGENNIEDPSQSSRTMRGTYVEIVGNGASIITKSNARTLDWNGNEVLAGKLTVGTAPTNNMDVATKQYVDNSIASVQNITEVTITTAGAVSQALDAGKIYHFTGAVSSLSLTLNAAANGQLAQYHFDFTSGSTATTIIINGVTWIGGSFVPEVSKRYEVDILNGYGVYLSW